jgi:predicted nucleic acid-binding protein
LIYVDTSAIVAALDSSDPRSKKAREVLKLSSNKIISELAIAELASVLARQSRVLAGIRDRLGINESVAFIAVILYILKRFDLRYISIKGYSRTLIGNFYKPVGYTIGLAEKLKLRTLDLLHLAYIKALKEESIEIHTLLTADSDFKDNEESIQKILGISINLIK